MYKVLILHAVVQEQMPPPGVEVCGIWVSVLRIGSPVEVKDEFIRGEEEAAVGTFDTLGSGTVVPRRYKLTLTPPTAGVLHTEGKVLRKFGWSVFF